MYYEPNYLAHHGIKGQKWGVRRYQNEDGSLTAEGRKKYGKNADDAKKVEMKLDSKYRRTLSDEELRAKIQRLKLEKELKDLTDQEVSPGKAFVNQVLSDSGKQIATKFVTGAGLYTVKAAANKKFDVKEAADYMAPKPKK